MLLTLNYSQFLKFIPQLRNAKQKQFIVILKLVNKPISIEQLRTQNIVMFHNSTIELTTFLKKITYETNHVTNAFEFKRKLSGKCKKYNL